MSRIAMTVGEGFEDSELRVPYDRLREAGHEVVLVGIEAGSVLHGKQGDEEVTVEQAAATARAEDFDALVIPGGHGPDHIRTDADMVRLTRDLVSSGKTVGAICHGPQLLIEADAVRGRTLTSWPSVRTDLINAGAEWVDEAVVQDVNLVTSRKPADLDAFCDALLARL